MPPCREHTGYAGEVPWCGGESPRTAASGGVPWRTPPSPVVPKGRVGIGVAYSRPLMRERAVVGLSWAGVTRRGGAIGRDDRNRHAAGVARSHRRALPRRRAPDDHRTRTVLGTSCPPNIRLPPGAIISPSSGARGIGGTQGTGSCHNSQPSGYRQLAEPSPRPAARPNLYAPAIADRRPPGTPDRTALRDRPEQASDRTWPPWPTGPTWSFRAQDRAAEPAAARTSPCLGAGGTSVRCWCPRCRASRMADAAVRHLL
jgi:hypothetical protein